MSLNHFKPTRDQIFKMKEFSQQKVMPWLMDALLDWLIIIGSYLAIGLTHSIIVFMCAFVVIGNRQHALAILGHDGAHYTIHSNKTWNDVLSNLFCFWPLLITTGGYRQLHFTHHNSTGSSKDPELLHKQARAPQWDLPLQKKKLFWYAIKDLFGYSIPDLCIILTFSRPRDPKDLRPVFVLNAILIVAAVCLGLWWVPLVWYGSLATVFMMFFRLRLWIEHQGTFATQRITLSRIQGMILSPHKAWMHWEHHVFPTIPYHKLEEMRPLLMSDAMPIKLSELIDRLCQSGCMPSGASLDFAEGE